MSPSAHGPLVLVTDAERSSALAVARSLGRAGHRVLVAAREGVSRAVAERSRHAEAGLRYPDPALKPDRFLVWLDEIVARRGVDLVLPVTDDVIHPMMAARSALPARARFVLPPQEAFEIACDKARTVELATRVGVDVPRTGVVRSPHELDAFLAGTGSGPHWPVVVKPAVSRERVGDAWLRWTVAYARDEATLRRLVAEGGGRMAMLLQEYVAGEGVGVELLCDRGRVRLAFQHRRLAEVPITGGASAWCESMALDPTLLAAARRLAAALRWHGLMMVEFKCGNRTVLMEINGRVWGSMPLPVAAGCDFPADCARLFLEDGAEAAGPGGAEAAAARSEDGAADGAGSDRVPSAYEVGLRLYNPQLLPVWGARMLTARRGRLPVPVPARRQIWPLLADLLRGRSRSDLEAEDDPAPARGQWRQALRRQLGKRLRA